MSLAMERPVLPETVVRTVERAVVSDRLTSVAPALARLAAAGAFDEPGLFAEPRGDRYVRRLLWRDVRGRFTIIAITWAAGQYAPLHDHGRSWGADVVVRGVIHERQYELSERTAGGLYRFSFDREVALSRLDVGVIVPPREYHAMENRGTQVANSIHVYRKELRRARVFDACGPQLWKARMTWLVYDEQ